ncbi:MAG TPA: hypothetical protein VKT32_02735, partial [Chthonomonadaceae bacterium]|nr:hypothetical protein [Chthonomonadaceae bacterium]
MIRHRAFLAILLFFLAVSAMPAPAQNLIGCWDTTRAVTWSLSGGSDVSQFSSAIQTAFPGMNYSATS